MNSPPKILIREAALADLPAIVRMLADDELGKTREDNSEDLSESYETAFAEISSSESNQLLVSVAGEHVVGVLQLTFVSYLTFKGGRRALIEGVRVASDHRSKGIGRFMIEDAISRAKARGCHLVQLTSNKARTEAKRFYESLGFEASHEGLKLSLDTT
ncbi:MAG: GNAT family N-acetyltransferase [Synoicihabitans sp.]